MHPSFGRVPFAKQEPKSTTHLRQTLNFQKGQIEKKKNQLQQLRARGAAPLGAPQRGQRGWLGQAAKTSQQMVLYFSGCAALGPPRQQEDTSISLKLGHFGFIFCFTRGARVPSSVLARGEER